LEAEIVPGRFVLPNTGILLESVQWEGGENLRAKNIVLPTTCRLPECLDDVSLPIKKENEDGYENV
jgi:hypothetical protein